MEGSTAAGKALLLKVHHKVGNTESVKVVRFSSSQTISEAVQTVALKYLRHNPSATYENFGFLVGNGQFLDEDRTLGDCGLVDNAIVSFKSKLHQIVVKFVDDTSRRFDVNIALPIRKVVQNITQQMEFRLMTDLQLFNDYGDVCYDPDKSLYSQADLEKPVFRLSQKNFNYSNLSHLTDFSQITPFELHLLYIQALKFVVSGAKKVCFEDAILLAAIQAQEEYGDFNSATMGPGFLKLRDYLSYLWVKAPSAEADIFRRYRRLTGTTKAKAKTRYIVHCSQLPDYEIFYYTAKEEKSGARELIFAVACDSIFRMDQESKEILTHYPLVRLKRWKVNKDPDGLKMDFGDYEDGMVVLKTAQGEEISQKLSEYIDLLTKKKKGETKASKCEVSGSGLTSSRVMTSSTFVIQAKDGNGCNKTAGGDEFRVYILPHSQLHLSITSLADLISSNQVLSGTVTDNADGTYSVTYSLPSVGVYSIYVLFGKNQLPGSPFRVTCRADASPSKSIATGEGTSTGVAGQPAKFDVVIQDEKGEPIRVGGDQVVAGFEDRDSLVFVHDNEDGTYTVSFTRNIIGSYKLAVFLNGEPIRGSPFTIQIVPGKILAPNCFALGESLYSGVAGEQGVIAIQAVDLWGNSLTTGGHSFAVSLQGATNVVSKVEDHADGRYYASYMTAKAGVYSLSITHLGQHIKGSPYTCIISHGDVRASNSYVIGGFPKTLSAGEAKAITILTCDGCENEVQSGDSVLIATVESESRSEDISFVYEKDGRYSYNYSTSLSGKYTMRVLCDGQEIKNSPFYYEVTPADLHHPSCLPTANLPERITSGTQAKFTVELKDTYGNLIKRSDSRFINRFSVEVRCGQSPLKAATLALEGNGLLGVSFPTSVAGDYSISVFFDDVILGQKLTTSVVAGNTYGPSCVAFGDGLFGGLSGQEFTFVIQAKDLHFNLKTTGGDEFRVELSGAMLMEAKVFDEGNGKYRVSYAVDRAGQYIISATYSGQHIMGSPFVATIKDPSQVSVLETQQQILLRMDKLFDVVVGLSSKLDDLQTKYDTIVSSLAVSAPPTPTPSKVDDTQDEDQDAPKTAETHETQEPHEAPQTQEAPDQGETSTATDNPQDEAANDRD